MSLFLLISGFPLPALLLLISCMFTVLLTLVVITAFFPRGAIRIIRVIDAIQQLFYSAGNSGHQRKLLEKKQKEQEEE